MLAWACNSFSGATGTDVSSDASSADGTTNAADDGATSKTDGSADAFAPCDPTSTTPPSDTHNCGVCGHDCLGGACNAGLCAAVVAHGGLNHPQAMSLLGTTVYVTENAIAGNLYAFPKDGGSPAIQYNGNYLGGVAATPNAVYFAVTSADQVRIAGGGGTSVMFTGARFVLADDAGVAMANAGAVVGTIAPGLSGAVTSKGTASPTINALTMDDSGIYISFQNGAIAEQLALMLRPTLDLYVSGDAFVQPSGILSVGSDLYFFESGEDAGPSLLTLKKANFQMSKSASPVATGLVAPTLLAADAVSLYLVDADKLFRIDIVTHVKTLLLSGTPNIAALAVDDSAIYFTVQGSGALMPEDAGALMLLAK
jgi:hypothetical protein